MAVVDVHLIGVLEVVVVRHFSAGKEGVAVGCSSGHVVTRRSKTVGGPSASSDVVNVRPRAASGSEDELAAHACRTQEGARRRQPCGGPGVRLSVVDIDVVWVTGAGPSGKHCNVA